MPEVPPHASKPMAAVNDPPDDAQAGHHPSQDTAVLRILDAEANRAGEGLRVVEDYVRFVLDDGHLTKLAKSLRHDLTEAIGTISTAMRLAARDTARDVGVAISTPSEQVRADVGSVATANFKRVQQALRSLEEYAKLADRSLAGKFESIRYQVYSLERAVSLTAEAVERLEATRLYVLVDGRNDPQTLAKLIDSLVDAGVDAIQLRDKRLSDRELLLRARIVREQTRETSTLFVMNDRPDLAVLAAADGVHVGQEELGVKEVRAIVGPNMLVGVSTHNIEQARQAVLDGAHYIGLGPTFPSTTKSFETFAGVEFLKQVATEIRLPAFAIGGITPANVRQVVAAGVRRIAVGSAMIDAADVKQVAAKFRAALTEN